MPQVFTKLTARLTPLEFNGQANPSFCELLKKARIVLQIFTNNNLRQSNKFNIMSFSTYKKQ